MIAVSMCVASIPTSPAQSTRDSGTSLRSLVTRLETKACTYRHYYRKRSLDADLQAVLDQPLPDDWARAPLTLVSDVGPLAMEAAAFPREVRRVYCGGGVPLSDRVASTMTKISCRDLSVVIDVPAFPLRYDLDSAEQYVREHADAEAQLLDQATQHLRQMSDLELQRMTLQVANRREELKALTAAQLHERALLLVLYWRSARSREFRYVQEVSRGRVTVMSWGGDWTLLRTKNVVCQVFVKGVQCYEVYVQVHKPKGNYRPLPGAGELVREVHRSVIKLALEMGNDGCGDGGAVGAALPAMYPPTIANGAVSAIVRGARGTLGASGMGSSIRSVAWSPRGTCTPPAATPCSTADAGSRSMDAAIPRSMAHAAPRSAEDAASRSMDATAASGCEESNAASGTPPAAADAALGAPPQTPPGALPLDPGFFPSGVKGEAELETKDQTLITAGT